ncbi:AraC family transcriptional regulator [Bariatricus sp. HCP28S3_A7]|uniref:AraC family transcriptional regulator n=1 Tax=Lachnospiraceae TaxID=186803 RepID=UPI002A7AF28B|nr:AraC family transcriptional regulator [bacterium]MDY2884527.1 AraC family transcriptional regulator [Bariatricus sp.]MDY4193447.1 AraC family transcriptional regulator [Bariatricus sp.]MDY5030404.1 AraC family transcriptional regulator [Blautia sp.]
MNINTNYTKILTDENLMETVQHGNSSYPFQFYYEDLSVFDFNCIEWHWHTELEFIYIESGTVTFWIGEDQFKLSEGDGIFINTKVLHRLYSPSKALIPNFVFMPSFIAACDSFIYQKYILPVISSSLSFLIFHKEVCWQARALTVMQQIISAQDSAASKELITVSLLQNLWQEIFENADIPSPEEHKDHSSSSQARLQLMMQFIHLNYSQNISLDDIAREAMVSKSTALNLFRKYLHITPVNYLINYRLKQASQLLSKTEKKIHLISSETGFHNVEYFCKIFKKRYNFTPTEYREQKHFL